MIDRARDLVCDHPDYTANSVVRLLQAEYPEHSKEECIEAATLIFRATGVLWAGARAELLRMLEPIAGAKARLDRRR